MRNLKLKYKNTFLEEIPEDTLLYEVSKKVKNDFKYPIVGARLGEFLVGLNVKVTNNEKVEFYDLSSTIGNRIYSRSLEFLVTVATKKILGDETDILINYSLENGIYCEIIGQRITKVTAEKIEAEMKKMVDQKFTFKEMIVDRFDAIKYFKKHHQIDKVEGLRYMTNRTVTLYSLDGIYDYFFGPLVYNTGVLDKFGMIYLKDNSFILTYPSVKDPNTVDKYIHHKLTFNTYKSFQNWGRTIGIGTAPDLNAICTEGKYVDMLRLFETHYEDQLSLLAETIYKKQDQIKIILLAGPSSSGKTTTAKKLSLYLKVKGINCHKISLDDYFIDRDKAPRDENGNLDFSGIEAIDITLFNNHLNKLLNGHKVLMPTFDFITGKKVYEDKYLKLEENDMLIIEGIHTLNEKLTKNIPRENKFKIFMSPLIHLKLDNHNRVHTTDVRKIRRIVRDNLFRGTNAETTLAMWPNVDKEARISIYPYQDDADAMINSSLGYELSVLRIYAEPLLYGIESTSPQYPEAIRLINLLRNFLPITSEVVPKDSILREFIGGSVFEE